MKKVVGPEFPRAQGTPSLKVGHRSRCGAVSPPTPRTGDFGGNFGDFERKTAQGDSDAVLRGAIGPPVAAKATDRTT
jgi:hypothetical protein